MEDVIIKALRFLLSKGEKLDAIKRHLKKRYHIKIDLKSLKKRAAQLDL